MAFLLAALRVRDPRVLKLLLDRLEYDAADGAFCLGLYGDSAAQPALEKMQAEVPESEADLRREIDYALEQLKAPEPKYQPEPFDLFAEYPERELPPFEVLDESERLEMLISPDADVRAGAAHTFFNQDLDKPTRDALFAVATADPRCRRSRCSLGLAGRCDRGRHQGNGAHPRRHDRHPERRIQIHRRARRRGHRSLCGGGPG